MTPSDRVLDWLIDEGQHFAELQPLLEGLIEQILAAGIPIDRMNFGFTVLHPNYEVQAGLWTPDKGLNLVKLDAFDVNSDAFRNSPLRAALDAKVPIRQDLIDPRGRDRFPFWEELFADGYTDYAALPLMARGEVQVLVTIATRHPEGFGGGRFEQVHRILRAALPLISLIRAERISSDLMAIYVGPATGARVLAGQVRPGDAESIEAVLWLCDLRDFTALTRQYGAEAMVSTVNAFFEAMAAPLAAYGGEVLKFVGDAMLAFFPSAGTEGPGSAASRAVTAAAEALDALAALDDTRRAEGLPPLRSGIALHFGQVLYGNIGTHKRLDFTVFGDAVNRVARVESLCAELDEPLLMTAQIAERAGRAVKSRGQYLLKGLGDPIEVFALA